MSAATEAGLNATRRWLDTAIGTQFGLRTTLAIAWREAKAYFTTPTAYVVGGMFVVFTGIYFVNAAIRPFAEASVRSFVDPASFFFILLGPLLTMRLLSEEQKMGTLELLLTAPVRDWEVVMGKYMASLLILVITIALTGYYVVVLYWFADPDTGPVLSAYLGLVLYGAAALAVGLLASSLSSNQIVAAVVGMGVLLPMSFTSVVASRLSGVASQVVNGLSLEAHLGDLTRGVVDVGSIVYFVSVAAVFLFLTVRSLETRRWR